MTAVSSQANFVSAPDGRLRRLMLPQLWKYTVNLNPPDLSSHSFSMLDSPHIPSLPSLMIQATHSLIIKYGVYA